VAWSVDTSDTMSLPAAKDEAGVDVGQGHEMRRARTSRYSLVPELVLSCALVLGASIVPGSTASSAVREPVSPAGVHVVVVPASALVPELTGARAVANPAVSGSWGPIMKFPIVPVAAALLPHNKLLTFSAYSPVDFDYSRSWTQTAIVDLTTGVVSRRKVTNTGHQMFCPGLALLPDGRLLVNGGSSAEETSIYDPATDSWSKADKMNIPRGYNSSVTLSNGDVLTLGGSWNGGLGGKNGEVWSDPTGWRSTPGISAVPILTNDRGGMIRRDNHAWLFTISNGGVFHAGPSQQMNWIDTNGNGTITSAGTRADSNDAMNGNAVMYDIGKIVTLGGAPSYQNSSATKRAYTIDISRGPGQPVVVNRTGNMAFARAFVNSVVLPDGTVLAVGGQAHAQPFSDSTAAMQPELWNPATGQFTLMAQMKVPRNYHSIALLLPDGTVFSGGGGLCGQGCGANHKDGQIFSPPYLFNSDGTRAVRPRIITAPTSAALGSSISVTTDSAVQSWSLIRTGSVTHSINTDQRRVPLHPTTVTGTTYSFTLPADSGVLVPGDYMLFAMNAAGVPSVSSVITIH
jgi:galactose oxidase